MTNTSYPVTDPRFVHADGPQAVECPRCKAEAGHYCVNPRGLRFSGDFHDRRYVAAYDAAHPVILAETVERLRVAAVTFGREDVVAMCHEVNPASPRTLVDALNHYARLWRV